MQKIDAHIHFLGSHPDAIATVREFDVAKIVNICTTGMGGVDWRTTKAEPYRQLADKHPDQYAWVTTFDLPDFKTPDYAERVIDGLKKDFAAGAVGCKIWKVFGMGLKDPAGQHVLPDHPILDPIYSWLEKNDRTLLAHIADPLDLWKPNPRKRPPGAAKNPSAFPERLPSAGLPSHAELIAARDRVIERHPRLRIVGAHLASLEYDLNEIANRLDRYPNFAVDTSARLYDMTFFPAQDVRDFITKYQDRVLFGTDIVRKWTPESLEEEWKKAEEVCRTTYARELGFWETAGPVYSRWRDVPGVNLPPDVLERFYVKTAQRWYPGL